MGGTSGTWYRSIDGVIERSFVNDERLNPTPWRDRIFRHRMMLLVGILIWVVVVEFGGMALLASVDIAKLVNWLFELLAQTLIGAQLS
jgi:hypothetical protein